MYKFPLKFRFLTDQPCPRKWVITIPDKYIHSGQAPPKKYFNLGNVNLEVEVEGETFDCIHWSSDPVHWSDFLFFSPKNKFCFALLFHFLSDSPSLCMFLWFSYLIFA